MGPLTYPGLDHIPISELGVVEARTGESPT